MTIKGFGNDVIGPKGKFRVELQEDIGVGPCVWSVEEIPEGPIIGSTFMGTFATQEEAIYKAKKYAGWTAPVRLTDRRGLVAHSRELHGL